MFRADAGAPEVDNSAIEINVSDEVLEEQNDHDLQERDDEPGSEDDGAEDELFDAMLDDSADVEPNIPHKVPLRKDKAVVYNYCLHTAAYHGHSEVVEYLLSNGADASLRNYWDETPLKSATYSAELFKKDATKHARILKCVELLRV